MMTWCIYHSHKQKWVNFNFNRLPKLSNNIAKSQPFYRNDLFFNRHHFQIPKIPLNLNLLTREYHLPPNRSNYRHLFNPINQRSFPLLCNPSRFHIKFHSHLFSTQSYPYTTYLPKPPTLYFFLIILLITLLFISPYLWHFSQKTSLALLTDEQMLRYGLFPPSENDELDYNKFIYPSLDPIKDDQFIIEQNSPLKPTTFIILYRSLYLTLIFSQLFLLIPLAYFIHPIRDWWWRQFRQRLGIAGGCWIKLGQWASTRPDIFDATLIDQLKLLQDQCPAHNIDYTRQICYQSYGINIEDLFDFNPEPIASGAIAQVYKAKVKLTGEEVIIKVRHPDIEKLIAIDLKIMSIIAKFISYFPNTQWLSFEEAIFEFSRTMHAQIDMRNELRHLLKFSYNFEKNANIIFPKPIPRLSTKHILVETMENGQSLTSYLNGVVDEDERKSLAKLGLHAFLNMLLLHNFIHADLHPGNILVRKNPTTNKMQLVLLDFGLVCKLSSIDWLHFKQLFKCIVQGNGKEGAQLMIQYSRDFKITDKERIQFINEVDQLFSNIRTSKLSEIKVSFFLSDLLSIVRKYRVKIESNFTTLCVATIVLEGIGRQLDPNINILTQSVPILMWSEKANLEDRMVFLRERFKDEFDLEDEKKPIINRVLDILQPLVESLQMDY